MILTIMMFLAMYMVGAGGVGKVTNAIGQGKCHRKHHDWEECGHYYTGILAGAFWPLAVFLVLGMRGGTAVPLEVNKKIAEQKKRDDELKAIEHRAQIEQAQLMEEEMLNRRLEIGIRQMEIENRRLELTAKGVPDHLSEDVEVQDKKSWRSR